MWPGLSCYSTDQVLTRDINLTAVVGIVKSTWLNNLKGHVFKSVSHGIETKTKHCSVIVRPERKQTFLLWDGGIIQCQHRTWQSWSLPATTMKTVIYKTTRQNSLKSKENPVGECVFVIGYLCCWFMVLWGWAADGSCVWELYHLYLLLRVCSEDDWATSSC